MRHGPNRRATPLALVLALLAGFAISREPAASEPEGNLPRLVMIRPGTRIEEKPPSGWSDLVLKSMPKLESGDLDSLPAVAASTATLFRTVILADVRRADGPGSRYILRRIGLGLCVSAGGKDTVVSQENPECTPVSLGLVESQVLTHAENELKKARLVSRGETFAVLAAPSEVRVGREHRKMLLVYALAVDPATGRLDTLLWDVSARRDRRSPPASMIRLPHGLAYTCGLDVTANRLLGTVPMSWSFALCSLPPGRRVDTPKALSPWLIDLNRIASHPAEFERLIRERLENGGGQ